MRMKSGVQLNFLERRALADRALSRLVQITRDDTAAMTSREQRGVYQLEPMFVEGASAMLPPARLAIDPKYLARWKGLKAFVSATAREFWYRKLPVYWQRILAHRARVSHRFGHR